jgi:hypothetical protein
MTRVYKEINGTSKVYVFSKVEMKKNGAIVVKNDKEKIAELESELSKLKAQIDSNKEVYITLFVNVYIGNNHFCADF